jgi:hypothetical protein
MKLCVHTVQMSNPPPSASSSASSGAEEESNESRMVRIPRRKSEDGVQQSLTRPRMMPRSMTASPITLPWLRSGSENVPLERPVSAPQPSTETIEDESQSTILVGTGGTLLKSSVGSVESRKRQFRVLVVEDNSILRNLL